MIDSPGIFRQADGLVRLFGTRHPETIAGELGIWIREESAFRDLLGMYAVRWRHRMIFLNPSMPPPMRQMVIGHELGHDALHRTFAKVRALQEFTLFNMKDTTEYEANAFAAHILLDNETVYRTALQGHDIVQMAGLLQTDINLLLIKLQEMNRLGYDFRVPITPDGSFFRKLRPDGSDRHSNLILSDNKPGEDH